MECGLSRPVCDRPQVKEVVLALEEDGAPEFTSKPEPIVVEEKQEIVIVATIKGEHMSRL